jgi:phosphate transport system permease protein
MTHKVTGDKIFKYLSAIIAASALVILIATLYVMSSGSVLAFQKFGFSFITGTPWNPVIGREAFGIAPYILGTLLTSGLALLIGVPLSLGIAIFLSEMSPKILRVPLSYLVELLAAVPSVIYGLWGIFVLRFWLLDYIEKPLNAYLGWIPLFSGTPEDWTFSLLA